MPRTAANRSGTGRVGPTGDRARRRDEGRSMLYAAAEQRYRDGLPLDIAALAAEHGISRATAYRWLGDSDQLLADILRAHLRQRFRESEAKFADERGAERIHHVLVDFMRIVDRSPRFNAVLSRNPTKTLTIVASGSYSNQRDIVGLLRALIEEEQNAGAFAGTADAETLAYALVRLIEAFLYADVVAGESRDLNRASEVVGYLLRGASTPRSSVVAQSNGRPSSAAKTRSGSR